eukprot:COSAG06_NODE_33225_length_493_cov_1.048223_1_plen_34_part_10
MLLLLGLLLRSRVVLSLVVLAASRMAGSWCDRQH